MKQPLALMLTILIALPSFAAGEMSNDELKTYIDTQRAMIAAMRAHPDDVKKLNADLLALNRSYYYGSLVADNQDKISERLVKYQQHFNQVASELRANGEWSPRKQKAWEDAEKTSPSSRILEWASNRQEQIKAEADRQRLAAAMAEQQRIEAARQAEAARKEQLERLAAESAAIAKAKQEAEERRAEIYRKAQEEEAAAIAERERKIAEAREAARRPRVIETDEGFTRNRLGVPDAVAEGGPIAATQLAQQQAEEAAKKAEAERIAAEAAKKAEAERLASVPTVTSHDDVLRAKRQADALGRAWVEGGPMGVEMARIRAGQRPELGVVPVQATTPAGATHPDSPAARPIQGPSDQVAARPILAPTVPKPQDQVTAGTPGLSQSQLMAEIKKIAKASGCIGAGRSGHAVTEKYLYGLTLGYARAMCRPANDPVRTAMTGVPAKTQVASLDGQVAIPSNEAHLNTIFQNILSLGLYESDGRFGEGRDRAASNLNGSTTEAGFLQTSYNVHGCNQRGNWAPAAKSIIADYLANPQGCGKELLNGGSSERSYGSGAALQFQQFVRSCPLGAVEHAAVTLKNCPQHYGPWNTGVARAPVPRCANVFKQVAELMNKNRGGNCQQVALKQTGAPQVATRQDGRQ